MRSTALLCVSLLLLAACSDPGQTEIARGNVFASQKKFDEAIEAYGAAAKAAPAKARPRELLGHVYFDQKRYEQARAAYREALEVEPAAAIEAEIGLARIEAEQGKIPEAIGHLGKVLERQPANVYARLSRANLAMKRGGEGDAQLAIEDTAEAMKVDAQNPAVLFTRGCAFIAAGEAVKAKETFELLAKSQPRSPLAWYGLARVAGANKARADVILNLREAKSRAKDAPGAWSPDEVKGDPAFRFMKDDPDFVRELTEP